MIIRKVLSAITAAAMLATTLPITVAFADNGTENKPTEQAVSAVEQISEPIMEDAEIAETLPYQDTSLSFEERAADLVARMTLEEKVSQTGRSAPAIKRLGVPLIIIGEKVYMVLQDRVKQQVSLQVLLCQIPGTDSLYMKRLT